MYDSATRPTEFRPVPSIGLRIAVTQRRFRFAALLSRLSGRSLEDAWRSFRPLPAPDGAWGVPDQVPAPSPD